jgi:hypothetical protein
VAHAEVKSFATRRFWNLLHALPADVQKLAAWNYLRWLQDPNHPSLHFRRLKGIKTDTPLASAIITAPSDD